MTRQRLTLGIEQELLEEVQLVVARRHTSVHKRWCGNTSNRWYAMAASGWRLGRCEEDIGQAAGPPPAGHRRPGRTP